LVCGGESESDGVAVSVGWIGDPSVLQEVVLGVQLDVVEVESDHHGNGKRSIQGVVVVEVVVDEGLEVVGSVKDTLESVDGESRRSVEVMVDVAVEFLAENFEAVGRPLDSARRAALSVGIFVFQEYCCTDSGSGTSFAELGARASGCVESCANWALTLEGPSLRPVCAGVAGGGVTAVVDVRLSDEIDAMLVVSTVGLHGADLAVDVEACARVA